MSSIYLPKGRSYNRYSVLRYQQQLIEEHYTFLTCKIVDKVLICTGWIKHEDFKYEYKVRIECVAGKEPKSTILYPIIEPSEDIHMYEDHSICLHYPPDKKWNEKVKIYLFTVPWIGEWILYYELYLVNGNKWEGRESPTHIRKEDMNVNKDVE